MVPENDELRWYRLIGAVLALLLVSLLLLVVEHPRQADPHGPVPSFAQPARPAGAG